MNILQSIFNDHYEYILYAMHPRDTEVENIDKMLACGDPSFGGAMYACSHCGNFKFVPFRCHSRFCPSCGNIYSIKRALSMASSLIHCTHRHCVFTIPEQLRDFLLHDRSLLNCLFSAVRSVILRMFLKLNHSEAFTPGFICVLHTFGRDLKWNPHIHCLVSEGGVGNSLFWRKLYHFPYPFLRHAFCTTLLNEMQDCLGSSFKKMKAFVYKHCQDGFYVYAEPNLADPNTIIKYIGRYLGRPPIATSRIDSYDGDSVTFHYNRHEDDVLVHETIPAIDFIKRLIRHIPEKQFKMVRYYGIYARHRDSDKKLFRFLSKQKHKFLLDYHKWRNSILLSFGYDPLKCSICGNTMVIVELYYRHQRVSLQELYRKAMEKHHCRSPDSSAFTNPPLHDKILVSDHLGGGHYF